MEDLQREEFLEHQKTTLNLYHHLGSVHTTLYTGGLRIHETQGPRTTAWHGVFMVVYAMKQGRHYLRRKTRIYISKPVDAKQLSHHDGFPRTLL
jgi:hypothetical protein